jgi:hypothetical protein
MPVQPGEPQRQREMYIEVRPPLRSGFRKLITFLHTAGRKLIDCGRFRDTVRLALAANITIILSLIASG